MEMIKNYCSIYLAVFCLITNGVKSQEKWSLEECILYAKENNIQVVKQIILSDITDSDIKISKGNYLPDVNFMATQSYSLGNSFNVSTGVGQLESSSNSFRLSSSLNLFNGFKNSLTYEKSILSKEKSLADIEKIQFELALKITNLYLIVLFNKEIEKVAEEQVEISVQNLLRLKRLYQNGMTGKKELLEIESVLASDKKELVVSRNKVKNSLIELKGLLDIKQIEKFDIEDLLFMNPPITFFNLDSKVIENIPSVLVSGLSAEIKNKEMQLSRVNFYPKLSLNYSFMSNYFHLLGQDDLVFDQDNEEFVPNGFWIQLLNNRTHFIGISAIIPIFNRFSYKENYIKAQKKVKISLIELENNKKQVMNDIQAAINDLEASQASFDASEVALKAQKQAFVISQNQYQNGNIGNYEYLESKQEYIKKISDNIKSKYEYYFKSKVLQLYMNPDG